MKKFVAMILVAVMMISLLDISFAEPYIEMAVVHKTGDDGIDILDAEGNMWTTLDMEYEIGDVVFLVMEDNRTEEVEDDIIVLVMYYGDNVLRDFANDD